MLVKDHLNLPALLGLSPTLGVNDLYWGPRFINMHNCYDTELRELAKKGQTLFIDLIIWASWAKNLGTKF